MVDQATCEGAELYIIKASEAILNWPDVACRIISLLTRSVLCWRWNQSIERAKVFGRPEHVVSPSPANIDPGVLWNDTPRACGLENALRTGLK